MDNNDAIIIQNISKVFGIRQLGIRKLLKGNSRKNGKILALDDISFNVSKGEMFGIIGLNGSGKTTLLRIIAGIYPPDSGSIIVNGVMAPLLQIGIGFHNEFDAKENVMMYGMLLGFSRKIMEKKLESILDFAELQKFSEMKLKHYSTGMRARLAFSTALQIDPDILLVDEILSVGDLAFRKKSFDAFLDFKKQGKTIVYTSHSLGMISEICDRVMLLHKGNLVMIGNPEETIQKYREMTK